MPGYPLHTVTPLSISIWPLKRKRMDILARNGGVAGWTRSAREGRCYIHREIASISGKIMPDRAYILSLNPFFAVGRDLFFPDGDGGFQRVDDIAAGVESFAAMRSSNDDDYTGFANL